MTRKADKFIRVTAKMLVELKVLAAKKNLTISGLVQFLLDFYKNF